MNQILLQDLIEHKSIYIQDKQDQNNINEMKRKMILNNSLISMVKTNISIIPNSSFNIYFDTQTKLLYIDYLFPKSFDIINNIKVKFANKLEIIFNYKKYDLIQPFNIIMFAAFMTCVKLRIYFDFSKRNTEFNLCFNGYIFDKSIKNTNKEYYTNEFIYKNGNVYKIK